MESFRKTNAVGLSLSSLLIEMLFVGEMKAKRKEKEMKAKRVPF